MPATASVTRMLRTRLSRPPTAMNTGWTDLEPIDHEDDTRAMNPSSVTFIRCVV
jgi:hypothetical protein